MILEDDDISQADVYISPPNDGICSDEDSGDENDGIVDNLTGNQLRASAEVVASYVDNHQERISSNEDCNANDYEDGNDTESSEEALPPPSKKVRCSAKPSPRVRDWTTKDIPSNLATQKPWPMITTPKFLRAHQTPTTLFELFFDDELVDFIVTNTNNYARHDKGDHSFTTNADEIRTFLAILLISGYNTLPRRTMYWEANPDSHNEAVAASMSRNRFDELMRFLHVSDNANLNSADRFTKVRPLYTMLNERCLRFYPFTQQLSIDESMVPYFGRHPSKQFLRLKPVRFGYKLWTLSTNLGYVIQFEPYAGAKQDSQEKTEFGLGGAVVLDLLSEMPVSLPYHVAFDNYFTSLKLLEYLSTKGIAATGTIRANRLEKCPLRNTQSLEKSDRGTSSAMLDASANVIVVAWRDNKVVCLASNSAGNAPVSSVSRWSRQQKQRVNVSQPNIVRVYNGTMGGVDRSDQNVSLYRIAMRTKKWWWPLFAHTVDLAMQNAWLLYRKTPSYHERPLDLLAFRRDVVRVYMMRHAQPPKMGRPGRPQPLSHRLPQEIRQDKKGHFFADSETQRRCAHCGKNTRKTCVKCAVGLHLHCFNVFHGYA